MDAMKKRQARIIGVINGQPVYSVAGGAVESYDSDNYGFQVAVKLKEIDAREMLGRVRAVYAKVVPDAIGDAASVANLIKLPAGYRVLPMSKIYFGAFGASRTLNVGYGAHTDEQGDAVAADPDAFGAAIDVSAAGSSELAANTKGYKTVGETPVDCIVAGGTWPIAGEVELQMLVVND